MTAAPRKATPTVNDTRTAVGIIVSELAAQFFERGEHIHTLMTTMLAREHGFLLGPPGTAKSALVRALCARITGATYWEILMDRQLGKEESFGPIDIALYDKTGQWRRNIEHTLADCHIAFVDEVGKAGPASLNPYLTAFNERTFKANGKPAPIPLISAIGASNELLEPELAAMWDRFLVRMRVDYLQEPGNFARLLESKARRNVPQQATTITLDEFLHAVNVEVPAVKVPPGIIDAMGTLRVKLAGQGVIASDRRWGQCIALLQASAYIGGRDIVDDDDMSILRFALWDVEEQIPTVESEVLSMASPLLKSALDLEAQIAELDSEIDARKGESVQVLATYGGEVQFKSNQMKATLNDLIEQANREGRSTVRLQQTADKLRSLRVKTYVECLNMDAAAADRVASN